MDPDLKAYLDDMQRANSERLSALAQRLEAVQQRSDTQFEALRSEMQQMDRHNRTLHEATQREVRQIAEGHQLLREHTDRRFQEYDRNLSERHIGPLEARRAIPTGWWRWGRTWTCCASRWCRADGRCGGVRAASLESVLRQWLRPPLSPDHALLK